MKKQVIFAKQIDGLLNSIPEVNGSIEKKMIGLLDFRIKCLRIFNFCK